MAGGLADLPKIPQPESGKSAQAWILFHYYGQTPGPAPSMSFFLTYLPWLVRVASPLIWGLPRTEAALLSSAFCTVPCRGAAPPVSEGLT